jgi:hypothetical protein
MDKEIEDEGRKRDRRDPCDPCVSVSRLVKLAVTISFSVTLTVTLSVTLTINLLSKLNLQVPVSNQSPTTTGGTCCQFNLHVVHQSPSVIKTTSDSCCDSRHDAGYKTFKRWRPPVYYEPVYPVYERHPRPKRVRRRAAPPPPCMPCWDWGGGIEGEGPY